MRLPEKMYEHFDRIMKCSVFIKLGACVFTALVLTASPSLAQENRAQSVPDNGPKPGVERLSLQDAIERARRTDPQFQSAQTDAGIAKEDRVQARDGLLPSVVY